MSRVKTKYPGVFYREVDRLGGSGKEKMFYILFKREGVLLEEKVGRQYADKMTPAVAARIRAERIEGKRMSRKEIREERRAVEGAYTISMLWKEYKELLNPKNMQPDVSKVNIYILPSLGMKEPKDILPIDIDRIRLKSLAGKSPQTIKHVLSLIGRIISFGVKRNHCQPLPFDIEMPKVDNETTETLTDEELERLLKAIDEDVDRQGASVMELALYTGMRKSEILGLEKTDVDVEKAFATLRDSKGKKRTTIPLNRLAMGVLNRQPQTDSPYYFPSRNGNRRREIAVTANRITKKAGLPEGFRPLHGLRHVYASMLASSGQVDLYTLSKLLTHKDVKMTQRYAHLRDSTLRNASNIMGNIIEGIQKSGEVSDAAEEKSA